jgi:hypothetical protein
VQLELNLTYLRAELRTPLQWRKLDLPLRITVIAGILAGVLGMFAAQHQPVDYSAPPISQALQLGSLLSLVGAFSIMLVPMNRERRGILGFATFVIAVVILLSVV